MISFEEFVKLVGATTPEEIAAAKKDYDISVRLAEQTVADAEQGIALIKKAQEWTSVMVASTFTLIDVHMRCGCATDLKSFVLAIYARGYNHGKSAAGAASLFSAPVAEEEG